MLEVGVRVPVIADLEACFCPCGYSYFNSNSITRTLPKSSFFPFFFSPVDIGSIFAVKKDNIDFKVRTNSIPH